MCTRRCALCILERNRITVSVVPAKNIPHDRHKDLCGVTADKGSRARESSLGRTVVGRAGCILVLG
jgi:hypothetical protein